jgi:MSHA biogenesis protein MshJ
MFSVTQIKYWLQTRTQEQRILVLVSGLVVCLGIWYIAWESGYLSIHSTLRQQIVPLQEQRTAIDKQNAEMKKILDDPKIMQRDGELLRQLNNINAQIESISTHQVSASEMIKALKSILAADSGLALTRLENTANVPLILSTDKSVVGPTLYRHDFVVEFNGNYFATLNYLKRLEELPWQFYWDTINYEVTKHPEAKVSIKLHTVSAEEGLINV